MMLLVSMPTASGFAPSFNTASQLQRGTAAAHPTSLFASNDSDEAQMQRRDPSSMIKFLASAALVAALAMDPAAAGADEYGRETEAPTLFTGETVMICTKRGKLGACLKTEERTSANDNDKADKYFRDPADFRKRKDAEKTTLAEEAEGNQLIMKLRQQSEDNKEKNDLNVQIRTMQNDASASFGPFDRSVLILNADGKAFTLLENPQAMRLKEQGFIKGKTFVTQPTQEQIDAALSPPQPEGGGGIFGGILGIFGGSE